MTENTKSKQRIAALEAKLESTHAAMKDVLLSAWDEIDDLKQQNVGMKTQITELESALLFALENDQDLTDILKDFDSEVALAVA